MALSTVEDVVVAANLYMAYDLLKKQRKAVSETSTSATATARLRASAYSSTLTEALI